MLSDAQNRIQKPVRGGPGKELARDAQIPQNLLPASDVLTIRRPFRAQLAPAGEPLNQTERKEKRIDAWGTCDACAGPAPGKARSTSLPAQQILKSVVVGGPDGDSLSLNHPDAESHI